MPSATDYADVTDLMKYVQWTENNKEIRVIRVNREIRG
jgi:hypothetical protein